MASKTEGSPPPWDALNSLIIRWTSALLSGVYGSGLCAMGTIPFMLKTARFNRPISYRYCKPCGQCSALQGGRSSYKMTWTNNNGGTPVVQWSEE